MNSKTKKGLLIFFLAVLAMPFAEQCLNFIHSAPVYGAYNAAPDPEFSFENWWAGTYQDGKNKYINDNAGFRSDLLRINNQLDYSLFNKLHFEYGVMGTHGCVWDQLYINAYTGKDYIGHDKILGKMLKLKKIQDTLAALGKTLVFIQPASKAFFYPEYLPLAEQQYKRGPTNLETFVEVADSLDLNQIDFNAWLVSMKGKTKELLYGKQGIHWSIYGSALAEDSLVKYIERKRHISMPHITWDKIDHDKFARETDDDIGRQLNLVVPIEGDVYSYPLWRYPDEDKKTKPKAIYIGDSFLFQWTCLDMYDHVNSDWQVWFYFTTLCNKNFKYGHPFAPKVQEMDWFSELNKADYIVLMNTAKNLPTLGDGFIEQAYDRYFGGK